MKNVNHSMTDHPLDMFMAVVLAVLAIGALVHLPANMGQAEQLAASVAFIGLLGTDCLLFANSFVRWRAERAEPEEEA